MNKPRPVRRSTKCGQCVCLVQAAGFNIHAGAARNWPVAAKKLGYSVSSTPMAGSAIVTKESSTGANTGHVGIVQAVTAAGVFIKEMNYKGYGVVSTRLLAYTSSTLKTAVFIQPK